MSFNSDKLIIGFQYDSLDEFLRALETCNKVTIKTYVRIFISVQKVAHRFTKLNMIPIAREICNTLVEEKALRTHEQIVEIAIEKVFGEKEEVRVFIQKA